MIQIDSDDPTVHRLLQRLADHVAAFGGRASPHARVLAQAGELTVAADAGAGPETRVVEVPESCLPPIDAFRVTVETDAFAIRGRRCALPEPGQACFETMIELYNACGKLAAWRRSTP